MQKIIDQPTELARWLKSSGGQFIAFDGYQGAGKSALAQSIAKFLNVTVCHLDSFVTPKQGSYFDSLDLQGLRVVIDRRPILIEGVCVLKVLQSLNVRHDRLVYVSSPQPEQDTRLGDGSLAAEVSAYHREFDPEALADVVYCGDWVEGRHDMDQAKASVDIAYINAKTRIAVVLAIGGMLTLFVGLVLLFFGVTSQDRALARFLGVEVSAGGLGGVIMTTSVLWAFFAYKACPSYTHSSHIAEKYDSKSQLLERVDFESSTQLLIAPEVKLDRAASESAMERHAPNKRCPAPSVDVRPLAEGPSPPDPAVTILEHGVGPGRIRILAVTTRRREHLLYPRRDHLRRRAVSGLVEGARQRGRLQVQLHRARAARPRRLGEARGGVDLAGGADRGEEAASLQRLLDLVHVHRDLPKPDHRRAQGLGAAGGTGRSRQTGALGWRDRAAVQAPGLREFAVHVKQRRLSGAIVQVVDVLGDDENGAGVITREPDERVVGGVRLDGGVTQLDPSRVVERLHARGIAGECFRRGHVLKLHLGPNAVRVAEGGEAALAADARACEDDNAAPGHQPFLVQKHRMVLCIDHGRWRISVDDHTIVGPALSDGVLEHFSFILCPPSCWASQPRRPAIWGHCSLGRHALIRATNEGCYKLSRLVSVASEQQWNTRRA